MYSQIISKATKLREKSITAKKHALCTECCAAGYDRCPAAYPAPVPHFHSDAPECSLLPWFHRIPIVTEAAHRCSQCKRPNVQTNRRTVVLRQVNARRFNGRRPTMLSLDVRTTRSPVFPPYALESRVYRVHHLFSLLLLSPAHTTETPRGLSKFQSHFVNQTVSFQLWLETGGYFIT